MCPRDELRLVVNRIIAQKNKVPPDEQLDFIKAEIAQISDNADRDICETLVFGVTNAIEIGEIMASREERQEIRLFYSGLALLGLGALLVFLPGGRALNRVQTLFVQTLLALGAAAFSASIPGFLAIKGAIKDRAGYHNMTYKAAGGLAVFVIVFLWLPSLLR